MTAAAPASTAAGVGVAPAPVDAAGDAIAPAASPIRPGSSGFCRDGATGAGQVSPAPVAPPIIPPPKAVGRGDAAGADLPVVPAPAASAALIRATLYGVVALAVALMVQGGFWALIVGAMGTFAAGCGWIDNLLTAVRAAMGRADG